MNIKRQTRLFYAYEAVISFRVESAVWVIFLLSRGFSLAQVGAAEAVFHLTSVLCEIPTGMLADLFGRKRTLVLSGGLGIISSLCMGFGSHVLWIYGGMVCSALNYNLLSGTEQALFYDSLLAVKAENEYRTKMSRASIIGRTCSALACLTTPMMLFLGYRSTYLLSVGITLAGMGIAAAMKEPAMTKRQETQRPSETFGVRMKRHILDTARFIRTHPRTMCKLFADAAVACPTYLTMMYLQKHLVNQGWPEAYIGIPILIIPLMGSLGAWLASRRRKSLFFVVMVCGVAGGLGTCLAGNPFLAVIIIGAGISRICEGYSEIAVGESTNREFRSEERATMISVSSMLYSVLMIGASLLTGTVSERYSIGTMFGMLGAVLALMTVLLGLLYQRMGTKG